MVLRAMYGGGLLIALMGLATSPAMLLVLRLCQGAVTGTVSASNAFISSVTPARRASFSLGLMQTAIYVGSALGPLLGGVVADRLGYRWPFALAGALLLAGGVLVSLFAEEGPARPAGARRVNGSAEESLLSVFWQPGFAAVISIVCMMHLSSTVMGPIFPLYVETLVEDTTYLKTQTGALLAVTALAAALTAVPIGWLADRVGPRKVLVVGTLSSGALCALQALAPTLSILFFLRVAMGITAGTVGPAMGGLVNRSVSRSSQGKAYGLVQSANSLGFGLGPAAGGLLGAWVSLRAPFIFAGALQILVGVSAWSLLGRAGAAQARLAALRSSDTDKQG